LKEQLMALEEVIEMKESDDNSDDNSDEYEDNSNDSDD
jgi:hypothetical protein